jgi:hypothetical protein
VDVESPCKDESFSLVHDVGSTLTKDNFRNRGCEGNGQCMFCAFDESIDHLFFTFPFARFLWSMFQYAFDSPA